MKTIKQKEYSEVAFDEMVRGKRGKLRKTAFNLNGMVSFEIPDTPKGSSLENSIIRLKQILQRA